MKNTPLIFVLGFILSCSQDNSSMSNASGVKMNSQDFENIGQSLSVGKNNATVQKWLDTFAQAYKQYVTDLVQTANQGKPFMSPKMCQEKSITVTVDFSNLTNPKSEGAPCETQEDYQDSLVGYLRHIFSKANKSASECMRSYSSDENAFNSCALKVIKTIHSEVIELHNDLRALRGETTPITMPNYEEGTGIPVPPQELQSQIIRGTIWAKDFESVGGTILATGIIINKTQQSDSKSVYEVFIPYKKNRDKLTFVTLSDNKEHTASFKSSLKVLGSIYEFVANSNDYIKLPYSIGQEQTDQRLVPNAKIWGFGVTGIIGQQVTLDILPGSVNWNDQRRFIYGPDEIPVSMGVSLDLSILNNKQYGFLFLFANGKVVGVTTHHDVQLDLRKEAFVLADPTTKQLLPKQEQVKLMQNTEAFAVEFFHVMRTL